MQRYLLQATANPHDKAAAPDDLATWIGRLVEKAGGRLHELAYTTGDPDLIMVLELPGDANLAAFEDLGESAEKFKVTSRASLIQPAEAGQAMRSMAAVSAELVATPTEPSAVPAAAIDSHVETTAPAVTPDGDEDRRPAADEAVDDSQFDAFEPAGLPRPSMLATIGEMPPGSYELVAGRFTRFSELAAFSETVQALPGMKGVTIQQFLRGMVSIRIQYDSPIPLVNRLRELRQFKPEVRLIGPSQLEMLIFAETRGQLPSDEVQAPAASEAPARSAPAAPVAAPVSRNASLLHPAQVHEAGKNEEDASDEQASRALWRNGAAAVLVSVATVAGFLGHGRFF